MEDQIAQYIQTVLQREPNAGEVAGWVALIDSGALTLEGVRDAIIDSAEAQTDVYPVILGYQGIYGRVPDADGLDFWVNRYRDVQDLDNPATATVNEGLVEVLKPFVDPTVTQEFVIRFGANPTGAQFVTATYTNVLNRAPDAEGLAYWTQRYAEVRAQVDAQNPGATDAQVDITTRAIILEQFVSSVEYRTATVEEVDIFLAAAADGDPDAYTGSLWDLDPGTPGTNFSFTDAVGEILNGTANDDTFTGVLNTGAPADSTLNIGDQGHGLGGTDTMNLLVDTNAAATLPGGSVIDGMEIVNVISTNGGLLEGANAGVLDAELFGGVQQLWQANLFNDVENVGAGITVGFRGGAVGDNVQFDTASGLIALDNVKSGSTVGLDGKSATVLLEEATVSGSVASPGAGAPGILNVISGGAGFDAVETLNLALTKNTDISGSNIGAATLVTLDASESTGGIRGAAGAPGVSLFTWITTIEDATFGSGNDDVQAGNALNDLSVGLGAGADNVDLVLSSGAGFGALEVSVGPGADTVTYTGGSNIAFDTQAKFLDNLVTVTDFSTADDVLQGFGLPAAVFATQNVVDGAVVAANTLLQNLESVASVLDNVWSQFVYGGNLYVYGDLTGDNDFNAGDALIQLTGVGELLTPGDNLAA